MSERKFCDRRRMSATSIGRMRDGFLRRCRKRFGPHPSAVEHRLIGAEKQSRFVSSQKAFPD